MSLFWLCRKIFCSEVPLQRSLFCILLFLLLPSTPLREMLSVYIECTSHQPYTHSGLSPSTHHAQLEGGLSVTSEQHPERWTCMLLFLQTLWHFTEGHLRRNTCPRASQLAHLRSPAAIIRSPYLKIRANSENHASSKTERRESWDGGGREGLMGGERLASH